MLFGVHRNRTHVMNHDRSPNDPDASNGLRCRFTKWSCFPSFGDPIVVRFGARGGARGAGTLSWTTYSHSQSSSYSMPLLDSSWLLSANSSGSTRDDLWKRTTLSSPSAVWSKGTGCRPTAGRAPSEGSPLWLG